MHPLGKPIREVSSNLESLRDFVDTLGAFLNEKTVESATTHASILEPLLIGLGKLRETTQDVALPVIPEERMAKLLEKYPEATQAEVHRDEDTKNVTIKLPISMSAAAPDVRAAVQEVVRAYERTQMLYSSSLMNLTSIVELFFSNLLHEYFALHPEAIGTKEKLFSFEDLSKFESIAEARSHYVSSKIEDLLRGSLGDWLAFAKNTIKLSMGYLKDEQDALEETFQRRNIIVHNGGVANSIYISKVSPRVREGIEVGTDITPDDSYLSERIEMWERNCILIGAELWKQLAPADTTRADLLFDISHKHQIAGRWGICNAISTFVRNDKQMPERALLTAQIDYWQCQKRLGNWDKISIEVRNADYAAKGVRYQLARLALLEQSDEFFQLIPQGIQTGALKVEELRTLPIFEAIRQDQRFAQFEERSATVPKKRRRKKQGIQQR